jgi:hypothetical protein
MPIATSLAVAALMCAAVRSAPALEPSPPQVIVTVNIVSAISPALVARILSEAGDIWRVAGFLLVWDRRFTGDASSSAVHVASAPDTTPSRLRVVIGGDQGDRMDDPSVKPLGWIRFEAGSPLHDIYLSYANATSLLESSQGVVGQISTKTVAEREVLLGRAMGRALAHEIGHYLLASKVHTAKGLMQAKRNAAELFAPPRKGFQLQAEQRRHIAARLNPSPPVGRAQPADSR